MDTVESMAQLYDKMNLIDSVIMLEFYTQPNCSEKVKSLDLVLNKDKPISLQK